MLLLYKQIILCLLLLIGIASYFLLPHISMQAFFLFLSLVVFFYATETVFSLDFKKEHYLYLVFLSLSFLFFYHLHFLFVYIDKPLHLMGGFIIASFFYHGLRKKRIQSPALFYLVFSLSSRHHWIRAL
ncbi:MAG: hypothetical protein RL557_215 [archaeon]